MANLKFNYHTLVAFVLFGCWCWCEANAQPAKPFRRVDPNRVLQRYSRTNQLDRAASERVAQLDKQMSELEKGFAIERWQDCFEWDNLNDQYSQLVGLRRIPVTDNDFQRTCQDIKFARGQMDRDLQLISKLAGDTEKLHQFNGLIGAIFNMDEAGSLFSDEYAKFSQIVDEKPEFAKLLENIQLLAPEISDHDENKDKVDGSNEIAQANSEVKNVEQDKVGEASGIEQVEEKDEDDNLYII